MQERGIKLRNISTTEKKVEEIIKSRPADCPASILSAHQILLRACDSLQYVAIAWCTHDLYNQPMFEIEEQNLNICVSQLKTLLEKNAPSHEIRHLITVTSKAVDNFLAADFTEVSKKAQKSKVQKVEKKKKEPKPKKPPPRRDEFVLL